MSKTTVKKALAEFDREELTGLLMDLYAKSKDVKEILDFFATPDTEKKMEQYKELLRKEATRYTRHAFHPRLSKIRPIIKRFKKLLDPGAEATGELMYYVLDLFSRICEERQPDSMYFTYMKWAHETIDYLHDNELLADFMPRIRKSARLLKPHGVYQSENFALISLRKALECKGYEL